jgi:hypothetical protein
MYNAHKLTVHCFCATHNYIALHSRLTPHTLYYPDEFLTALHLPTPNPYLNLTS